MVFPLRMYSEASSYLAQADGLPALAWIGVVWIWVALAAWVLTGVSMVVHVMRTVLVGAQQP